MDFYIYIAFWQVVNCKFLDSFSKEFLLIYPILICYKKCYVDPPFMVVFSVVDSIVHISVFSPIFIQQQNSSPVLPHCFAKIVRFTKIFTR